jgi:DNA-binding CsgD family transcriptional regulator
VIFSTPFTETGTDRPHLALAKSRTRAALNPDIASIVAAAAHVSGLLENSPADLDEATKLFEQGPRRLEYASAMEDLGVSLVPTDRDAAIDALSRALATYVEIGAAWDARRVRRRLRELGVRRRIVQESDLTGWAAITGSELAVVRLVAEGLTNREVAERLFVSPHTVNSHLRHVFGKLGINSRVELARLARDHEQGTDSNASAPHRRHLVVKEGRSLEASPRSRGRSSTPRSGDGPIE